MGMRRIFLFAVSVLWLLWAHKSRRCFFFHRKIAIGGSSVQTNVAAPAGITQEKRLSDSLANQRPAQTELLPDHKNTTLEQSLVQENELKASYIRIAEKCGLPSLEDGVDGHGKMCADFWKKPNEKLVREASFFISLQNESALRGFRSHIEATTESGEVVEGVLESNSSLVSSLLAKDTPKNISGNRFGAVGCTLAHLRVVKKAYERKHSIVVIGEDDVSLGLWPLWTSSIGSFLAELPSGWHAVQLTSVGTHRNAGVKYTADTRTQWGTGLYALSRSGIEILYKRFFRAGRVTLAELRTRCRPLVADDCVLGFSPNRIANWLPGGKRLLPLQWRVEPPFAVVLPRRGIHAPNRQMCQIAKLALENCRMYLRMQATNNSAVPSGATEHLRSTGAAAATRGVAAALNETAHMRQWDSNCGCTPAKDLPKRSTNGQCTPFHPDRPDLARVKRTEAGLDVSVYPLLVRYSPKGNQTLEEELRVNISRRKVPVVVPRLCDGEAPLAIVGVFTTASGDMQRKTHRAAGSRSRHPCVLQRYVIGTKRLTASTLKALAAENETHQDLEYLEQTVENMNRGKSLDWLQIAFQRFPHATYIAKQDIDSFLHALNLYSWLSVLPVQRLVYGGDCSHKLPTTNKVWPSLRATNWWTCGEFYLFTRDVVERMTEGPDWRRNRIGAEDGVVSRQVKMADLKTLHVVSDWYRLIDFPNTCPESRYLWDQPLGRNAEAVLVHQLKKAHQWDALLKWLDATHNGTKPCPQRIGNGPHDVESETFAPGPEASTKSTTADAALDFATRLRSFENVSWGRGSFIDEAFWDNLWSAAESDTICTGHLILSSFFNDRQYQARSGWGTQDRRSVGGRPIGDLEPTKRFRFAERWWNSVRNSSICGLVLTDFPELEAHNSERVRAVSVNYGKARNAFNRVYGSNDVRFFFFHEVLTFAEEFRYVWMADLFDVIVRRPFIPQPHLIYVGQDSVNIGNSWASQNFEDLGGVYLRFYREELEPIGQQQKLWSAGLLGGYRVVVRKFLARLCAVLSDPRIAMLQRESKTSRAHWGFQNVNMAAVNYVVAKYFAKASHGGPPFNSNYRGFETSRWDVFFIHK
ncbi:unnamed protein product [Amoebophrya sp. A25]|nr:unnamed protein product [Amoebophrya sp. A25]|eukprot:GSA25T00023392001.1